jgi:trimethylamine--corrinoid protein Co-methyltransferase
MLQLWPEAAIEAMHRASLALLERVGVGVESSPAADLLLAAGCFLGPQGRVCLPAALIEEAVAAHRRRYVLAARGAGKSLTVGPDPGPTYVHNLGGARDVTDLSSGIGQRATMNDQLALTRIMHHLTHQQSVTALVQPGDVPDPLEPLYSYLALAWETDKVIGGPGISTRLQATYLHEMAKIVTGADGSRGEYPVDLAFSPVSPLILGAEVSEALVTAVRRGGVVVEILPCPAATTTAPATLAAAIAQQNAEVLAGLVLVQTVAPGTPTYYGPRLSAVDPRRGTVVSGSPETGISSLAATLLARRYGMACDCYGPSTDSKVADAQFGYERAFNTMIALAGKPRFLSGIGEIQAGVATSREGLVIDDEILNYAFYALGERPWDEAALNLDAMVEGVLASSGFLGTKHTRAYMHTEFCRPLLSYRGGLNEWVASGHSSIVDVAHERCAEYLGATPPALDEGRLTALVGLISEAAVKLGLTEWPDPRAFLQR